MCLGFDTVVCFESMTFTTPAGTLLLVTGWESLAKQRVQSVVPTFIAILEMHMWSVREPDKER